MARANEIEKALRLRWLIVVILLALGCTHKGSQSERSASLLDLSADPVPLLRQLPNVVEVKRHGSTKPTHRIIHIADWHFVEKKAFAADLRSQSDEPISDEEIDQQYAEHLNEVEAIQTQQIELLRSLIQQHGVTKVHIEGLAEGESFIFDAKMSALRKVGEELDELRKEKELLGVEANEFARQLKLFEDQYHQDLLQIGAAGRLLLAGELKSVLPLEDAEIHAASNPVLLDGSVDLDQGQIEFREDAQVKLLLAGDPVSIIMLGGAHDLSDNLQRIAPGKAEYIRVEVKAWQEIASK